MKKRWLVLPLFTVILILTLIPASFISANPGNLVTNGDFSDGLINWITSLDVNLIGETARVGPTSGSYLLQDINTTQKNLTYSVDVYPESFEGASYFKFAFGLFKNGGWIDGREQNYDGTSLSTGVWTNISSKLSEMLGTELPDFDKVRIYVQTYWTCIARFDNFKLTYPETTTTAEPVWVRTMSMTCWQVWINEDGDFQFSFIYPYADNNWVRIYDMSGKMVYEIDMPYDNPNLIVDLPDGMYTVKTFTVGSTEPIQTFIIGK